MSRASIGHARGSGRRHEASYFTKKSYFVTCIDLDVRPPPLAIRQVLLLTCARTPDEKNMVYYRRQALIFRAAALPSDEAWRRRATLDVGVL